MKIVLSCREATEILKSYLVDEGKIGQNISKINVCWDIKEDVDDSSVEFVFVE